MKIKVALLQMKGSMVKQETWKKAEQMVKEAAARGVDLVVLPEMWNCPYANPYFLPFSEEEGGETYQLMSRLARENGIHLVGGSIPERQGERVYNTSFFFDDKGNLLGKHRKAHLFDIHVPGKIAFMESEILTPGDGATVIDTKFGKIGLAICYDVRFPELFRKMALTGARAIILPAAFSVPTGEAHWEISLRARALDNQVYMLACSPSRALEGPYQAYGGSCIVDPWGQVLEMAGQEECIIYGQLDWERLQEVREQLPLLKHRRPELYE